MSFLSKVLQRIAPSPTMAVAGRARELKASGREVFDLGVGEPDVDTPDHVKAAAIAAIHAGRTKYTAVDGIIELKRAVVDKFRRENGLDYDVSEIIVCSGGKQVIYNALMVTLNAGDEVIIPAPYWVSYPDIVLLAGGTPRIVSTCEAQGFKLTGAALEEAIAPTTKWLILNSPSNPTGATYTRDELAELSKVLLRHEHVRILVDDIYEHLVYGGEGFWTLGQVTPSLMGRILTVNGVSKSYAMTGWRIGYGAGPGMLVRAMSTLQSQSTSNACSIAQWAAVEALEGPQDFIRKNLALFEERRDLVVSILSRAKGLSCRVPAGAFYVYASCAGCMGKRSPGGHFLETDEDFVTALLEEQSVAVVQGAAFGTSPYFRISYAAGTDVLVGACNRIVSFCAGLS